MAKRSKVSTTQKIITVSGVLILAQVMLLLFINSGEGPKTPREAIDRAISNNPGLSGARAEQARIQAAIMDFRAGKGRFPKTLQELVPTYFPSVPMNPETNEPFVYKIDGERYVLGDSQETVLASATGSSPTQVVQNMNADRQQALIASLSDSTVKTSFVYDPAGKRDPFSPFELVKRRNTEGATPLEMYTFGELKVTAILNGIEPPKAIVEDSSGRGYTVTKGTKVGPNGGEVVEILADKVVVLESEINISGEKRTRTHELPLRTGQ